jgi:hypothetical protein
MADNAFVRIDDWSRAQELADRLSPDQLHRADSDEAARVYRTYSAHRSNLMPPTNPI